MRTRFCNFKSDSVHARYILYRSCLKGTLAYCGIMAQGNICHRCSITIYPKPRQAHWEVFSTLLCISDVQMIYGSLLENIPPPWFKSTVMPIGQVRNTSIPS